MVSELPYVVGPLLVELQRLAVAPLTPRKCWTSASLDFSCSSMANSGQRTASSHTSSPPRTKGPSWHHEAMVIMEIDVCILNAKLRILNAKLGIALENALDDQQAPLSETAYTVGAATRLLQRAIHIPRI